MAARNPGRILVNGLLRRLSASKSSRKIAESGRNPSDIREAMEDKFKPLMETGKVIEAEAELDRVLKQLTQGEK
jgi:hypothetical protein